MANNNGERAALYTRVVEEFLKSGEFDLADFVKKNDYPVSINGLAIALARLKKYINPDLYQRLENKVYPFGVVGSTCSEEQRELREKVKEISKKIAYADGSLIDVLDNITNNMEEYLYYLKLSHHYYKDIGAGVLEKVRLYIIGSKSYRLDNELNVRYKDINEEEDKIIKKMLEDRDLPINSITYSAMREYAIAHKHIKQENTQRK